MDKNYIIKNLKQIKHLFESDCSMMAKERIDWLIDEIELHRKPWYKFW